MTAAHPILVRGSATVQEALALHDASGAADLDLMLGTWRGTELSTGHPLDGLLTASGWYGKQFLGPDAVHPLLFRTADGTAAFPVDPARVPLSTRLPRGRGRSLHRAVLAAGPLLRTSRPTARLRMTGFRGRSTATMIYDAKPVHDVFARLDDDTVLGLMDLRGEADPYFFVLRRDEGMPVRLSRGG